MISILARLLRKRPNGYGRRVDVRYDDTLVYEGYFATADKLFTKERTPLKPLVYHVFAFELDGVERVFSVRDDDRRLSFQKDGRYRAYLNTGLDRCWLDGHEAAVRVRQADEDEEDDEEDDDAGDERS
jgi:crotonobetainyl-CoA:carnitine CoA-transferase CaiB-like acyl-CoA transferase